MAKLPATGHLRALAARVRDLDAVFSCGGKVELSRPLELRFGGRKNVRLSNEHRMDETALARRLKKQCTPAPFGVGSETRRDPQVRDGDQLLAHDGALAIEGLDLVEMGILEEVRRALCSGSASLPDAELHALNVYTRGGHFVRHKDTPRDRACFGTLVVCLPIRFYGGRLVLQQGSEKVYDWEPRGFYSSRRDEPQSVQWAAFYGDVDHEVEQVTEGTRVTLTWLLRGPENEAVIPPPPAATEHDLEAALREALAEPKFLAAGGMLGVPCLHLYGESTDFAQPTDAISEETASRLKGRDRLVAFAAMRAGLSVRYRPYLHETCADEAWRLSRPPTEREARIFGRRRLGADRLTETMPIERDFSGRNVKDDVTWVQSPPWIRKWRGDDADPEEPLSQPASDLLGRIEYSATDYFGNEGGDSTFYVSAVVLIVVPSARERRAAKTRAERAPKLASVPPAEDESTQVEPPNAWCQTLGIQTPRLETAKDAREANTYTLLIVALLERGEAMTLAEVATRFDAAGVAPESSALRSLRRCRPARAPIYRDGDHYSLDPHDAEADLWAFRLGLRPAKGRSLRLVRPQPEPLPGPDVALTVEELKGAWKGASLNSWSAQRLTLAMLDAHGRALAPSEAVAFITRLTDWHDLDEKSAKFKRRGCPVAVTATGQWAMAADAEAALPAARLAVRARLEKARERAAARPDPAVIAAQDRAWARKKEAHARALAEKSRVLLVGFPRKAPRAVAMLDVGQRRLETFIDDELDALRKHLATYDIIGAENARELLRGLAFDPEERRLAELGPPQKTKKITKGGRTLKITTTLLVQGSCGISRPFGDAKKLRAYLAKDQLTQLRRRLEADVKSLHALYEYGRLHGALRLRWGFIDERLAVPWVHVDELSLYDLKKTALETDAPLEVVVGSAPGWSDPWSRARHAWVERGRSEWQTLLVDEDGYVLAEAEIQRARLVPTGRPSKQ